MIGTLASARHPDGIGWGISGVGVMSEGRKKPGVAFWATVVVVVLLVAYPLSFGPACWMCERHILGQRAAWLIFRPMTWLCLHGPDPIKATIGWYALACGHVPRFTFHEVRWTGECYIECDSDSVSPLDLELAREHP